MFFENNFGNRRNLSAEAALLSPDGKTVAVVQANALSFVQTDGNKVVCLCQEDEPSLSGLAWMNNNTLAVLKQPRSEQKHNEEVALDFISPDGTLLRSEALFLSGQREAFEAGELALAPDGRHMAISFGPKVYFLKTNGELLNPGNMNMTFWFNRRLHRIRRWWRLNR